MKCGTFSIFFICTFLFVACTNAQPENEVTETHTQVPLATPTNIIPTNTPYPTPSWQPLSPENAADTVELARPNRGLVKKSFWSPDGNLLFLTTTAGVSVYDGNTYLHIKDLDAPYAVADSILSHDGNTLIMGREDGQMEIWDVTTLEHIESKPIDPLHWCPSSYGGGKFTLNVSGRLLAIEVLSSPENCIFIWDMELGGILYAMPGHIRPVFSTTEPNLLATYFDGNIYMREAYDGAVLYYIPGKFHYRFSPDGTLFIAEYIDEEENELFALWHVEEGVLKHSFPQYDYYLAEAYFSNWHDTLAVVTNSHKGKLNFWDTKTGDLLQDLKISGGHVTILDISPDYNWMMINSSGTPEMLHSGSAEALEPVTISNNYIYWKSNTSFNLQNHKLFLSYPNEPEIIFELDANKIVGEIKGHYDTIYDMTLLPNENKILARNSFDDIFLLETFGDEFGPLLNTGAYQTTEIFYLSSKEQILAISEDTDNKNAATLTFWDTSTGQLLQALELEGVAYVHWINKFILSPDEKWLAGADRNGIIIWEVSTGKKEIILEYGFDTWGMEDIAFKPDGTEIVGLAKDTLVFWDTTTWEQMNTLNAPLDSSAVYYSSNNTDIIIDSLYPNRLQLWDEKNAQWVDICERSETKQIYDLAFNSDGQLLAIAHDNRISLCEMDTGQIVFTTDPHARWIPKVLFHSDDLFLFSVSWDGTMRYWGVP